MQNVSPGLKTGVPRWIVKVAEEFPFRQCDILNVPGRIGTGWDALSELYGFALYFSFKVLFLFGVCVVNGWRIKRADGAEYSEVFMR